MDDTYFAWPLRDGLRRGLARYTERFGGSPPAIWLRVPDATDLGGVPIRAGAGVPTDVVWFGPVCPVLAPGPVVYQAPDVPALTQLSLL